MDRIDLSSIRRKKPEPQAQEKPNIDIPNNVMDKKFINDVKEISKAMNKTKPENIKPNKDIKESQDAQIDKRRIILILQFYLLEFPDKLEAYKNIKFDKKSIEELSEIRAQMDGIISSKSNLKQTQMLVTSGIRMVEFATTYATPIKCEGLSSAMINDPDVIDDIKHIALKRMSCVSTEPEMRLAYKLVSNMMLMHNVNSVHVKPLSQEGLKNINNEYNDL